MVLTTEKYNTEYNVELTNPVFIVTSVSQNTNSHKSQSVSEKGTQVSVPYISSSTQVNYIISIFADAESYEGNFKGVPFGDGMNNNFNKDTEEYEGLSTQEACYKHFKLVAAELGLELEEHGECIGPIFTV